MVWFIAMLIGAGVVMMTSETPTRLIALVFTIIAALTWETYVDRWHDAKHGADGNQGATQSSGHNRGSAAP